MSRKILKFFIAWGKYILYEKIDKLKIYCTVSAEGSVIYL